MRFESSPKSMMFNNDRRFSCFRLPWFDGDTRHMRLLRLFMKRVGGSISATSEYWIQCYQVDFVENLKILVFSKNAKCLFESKIVLKTNFWVKHFQFLKKKTLLDSYRCKIFCLSTELCNNYKLSQLHRA